MNKIASNIVAEKALKDKQKHLLMSGKKNQFNEDHGEKEVNSDSDLSMDSQEEEIMRKMKEKIIDKESQPKKKEFIKGNYREKSEKEFFELIKQKKEKIVAHFFHEEFQKCQILHKNLEIVAYNHPETLFIKINAEKANFLV